MPSLPNWFNWPWMTRGPGTPPPTDWQGLYEYSNALAPVERDVPISPFYWKGAAQIVPMAAQARFDRLTTFRNLYEGHTMGMGLTAAERTVYVNYYARYSNLVKFLLMSFPPNYEGLNEEVLTPGAINKVLSEVIIDLTRYGTGLFWAAPGIIEVADPRYYFPSGVKDDVTYVKVTPMESADGQMEMGSYATVWWQRELMGIPVYSVTPFISSDSTTITGGGMPDGQEPMAMPGQVLWPVALAPTEGGFGPSVYQDMLSIVGELTRRQSLISGTLDENADPILGAEAHKADGVRMPQADDGPHREQLRSVEFSTATGRRRSAYVMPAWMASMSYTTWDGSLTAAFEQLDRMLTGLASVTALPEAMYGVLTSGGQPTGASLRRQHVAAYVMLETLQKLLIPVLIDVIRAAGGGEVDIVWLNPLERIDGEDRMMMDMFAGERDIATGRNLSEGEGEDEGDGMDAEDGEDE